MSTTAAATPPVAPQSTTKTIKKKVEKWEIENIGRFMLQAYHQHVVSQHSDWTVLKYRIREEFRKFLNALENANVREKFEEDSGTTDIGALLYRTNFLINTPRGSDHFRIKNVSLFQYRNRMMDAFDEKRKNGENEQGLQAPNTSAAAKISSGDGLDDIDPALSVLFQEDENSTSHELIYQATDEQKHIPDFRLTSTGCFICQRNFESPDLFETHVDYHGDESDFESLKDLEISDTPIFNMSYKLCKSSHYYCFTMETDLSGIIIDKIIIVRSRSMYYVHNTRVPYALPPSGKQKFFVDSHLFTVDVEHPIVVMCHKLDNVKTRIMEQHHVRPIKEYPMVHFGINPCRLPSKKLFKTIFSLPQYLPPNEIRLALKEEFANAHLEKISNDFENYLNNGKVFTQQNIQQAMKVLLQVEDMDAIREYSSITQRNAKLRKYANEYSLKLKLDRRIFLENVLSTYDEVVIIPDNEANSLKGDLTMDLLLKNTKDFDDRGKNNKKKTYFGIIERISNGRVTFISDKQIPTEQTYLVIFRPARLVLRYQYRALELFDQMPGPNKKRFLFPEAMTPLELPTNSLVLHNESISTNPEQLQAVRNIAEGPRSDATYIIFGPPGTGKTTTVVEAILQLYLRRSKTKILVTAGSNSACDEIALRLCKFFERMDEPRAVVRIYSRSNEKRSDNIDECLLEASNMYSGQFYPDIELLHEYRIVVCTLSVVGKLATGKFGKDAYGNGIYSHVFVDEVAASTEAEVLVGIMGTLTSQASLILAGDHKQLGPILQSKRAEELGLGVSLMERLLKRDCYQVDEDGNYDRTIQTRLCRNYRSHPDIVNLYSRMYYDSELIALASEDVKVLSQQWHRSPNPNYPIIFHSVFGTVDRKSSSLYNLRELEVVMDYVKDLMYFGVNGRKITQSDIGIISPYKKQYLRIQDELNLRHWYQIETGSVETFQGKEKPIIIVSFVRSFTSTLGFLENPRRLNVTLSRPKSLLILIGNPKTLSLNDDFKHIIEECRRNNTMVGAVFHELIDGITTTTTKNSPAKMRNLTKSTEKLNLGTNSANGGTAPTEATAPKANNQTETVAKVFKKKKWPKKKKNAATNNNNKNNEVSSGGSSDGKTEDEPQLGHSMKKHIKPTSQEKHRKDFEMFHKLLLADAKAETNSAASENKKTAMDTLFDELPSVPQTQKQPDMAAGDRLNANKSTEPNSTEHLNELLEMEKKLQQKIRELKLSLPAMDMKARDDNGTEVAASNEPTANQPTSAAAAKAEAFSNATTNANSTQGKKVYLKKPEDKNLAHFVGQNVVFIPASIYKSPKKSIEAPPQLNMKFPQTNMHLPQQNMHLSQQRMQSPQQNMHFLQQRMQWPQQNVQFPQQNMHLSQQRMQLPQQNMHLPRQNMHLPQQNMHFPQQNMHLTQQSMNFPKQNMNFPKQNMNLPQQNMHLPQQNMNLPQQNMNLPQQNMHLPLQNMHVPLKNQYSSQVINPSKQVSSAASTTPTKIGSTLESEANKSPQNPPPTVNLKWQRGDYSPQTAMQPDAATKTPTATTNSPHELNKSPPPKAAVNLKWQRGDNSPKITVKAPPSQSKIVSEPPAVPNSSLNLKWQRSDNSQSPTTTANTPVSTANSSPFSTLRAGISSNQSANPNSSTQSAKRPQIAAQKTSAQMSTEQAEELRRQKTVRDLQQRANELRVEQETWQRANELRREQDARRRYNEKKSKSSCIIA